tara:strand:+ start:2961 stop:3143 length:183 start_codon:yes stop_codon:yes gene_type:complete
LFVEELRSYANRSGYEILAKWQSSKTYNTAGYSLKTKGCGVDVYREAEIFDNCIIDKLKY